jgi:hypothetical protein
VNNVSLEKQLCEIENKMSNLKSITDSISLFDHRISNFDVQLKDVTQTVATFEANAKSMSDIFDGVKEKNRA